jgi:hypothetical protein
LSIVVSYSELAVGDYPTSPNICQANSCRPGQSK